MLWLWGDFAGSLDYCFYRVRLLICTVGFKHPTLSKLLPKLTQIWILLSQLLERSVQLWVCDTREHIATWNTKNTHVMSKNATADVLTTLTHPSTHISLPAKHVWNFKQIIVDRAVGVQIWEEKKSLTRGYNNVHSDWRNPYPKFADGNAQVASLASQPGTSYAYEGKCAIYDDHTSQKGLRRR